MVKEDDEWNRDDNRCTKMLDMIKKVEYKSYKHCEDWVKKDGVISCTNNPKYPVFEAVHQGYSTFGDKEKSKLLKDLSHDTHFDRELLKK
jgi:hypothetical protein